MWPTVSGRTPRSCGRTCCSRPGAGYCPSQTGARPLSPARSGCRPPRCGSAGGGATAAYCWISSSLLRLAFAETLARRLSPRPVYVPESYAAASGAIPLICTAISGGNFVQRLQEAAAGRDRAGGLALDVQRLRMDFTLPAQSGEGRPLSGRELQDLLDRESPSVFFSQDLCARYFTYARDGETHFVLFDDADTLSQKLRTGGNMGFAAAFLMYPEVQDLLPKLFPGRRT